MFADLEKSYNLLLARRFLHFRNFSSSQGPGTKHLYLSLPVLFQDIVFFTDLPDKRLKMTSFLPDKKKPTFAEIAALGTSITVSSTIIPADALIGHKKDEPTGTRNQLSAKSSNSTVSTDGNSTASSSSSQQDNTNAAMATATASCSSDKSSVPSSIPKPAPIPLKNPWKVDAIREENQKTIESVTSIFHNDPTPAESMTKRRPVDAITKGIGHLSMKSNTAHKDQALKTAVATETTEESSRISSDQHVAGNKKTDSNHSSEQTLDGKSETIVDSISMARDDEYSTNNDSASPDVDGPTIKTSGEMQHKKSHIPNNHRKSHTTKPSYSSAKSSIRTNINTGKNSHRSPAKNRNNNNNSQKHNTSISGIRVDHKSQEAHNNNHNKTVESKNRQNNNDDNKMTSHCDKTSTVDKVEKRFNQPPKAKLTTNNNKKQNKKKSNIMKKNKSYAVNTRELTALKHAAVKQVEYFFSIDELIKNVYMRKHMDVDGFLPAAIVFNFPSVLSFCVPYYDLLDALKDSESVEVNFENECLRVKGGEEQYKRWLFPNPDGTYGCPKWIISKGDNVGELDGDEHFGEEKKDDFVPTSTLTSVVVDRDAPTRIQMDESQNNS